jgi:hypothetical protein
MNKIIRQGKLYREHLCFSILVLCLTITFNSCNNDDFTDETFTIGDNLVEASTEIIYIDTLSVELSTVILDSVPTSNTGSLLIGKYTDGEFGSIQSKGFFALTLGSSDFLSDDVFDSLTLVLNYDGYSYGDTLVEQTINVYALTEDIELNDDGYLYNTSDFNDSKILLGQLTYTPKPSDDYIEIRLSDDLGREFFTKLVNGDDEFASEAEFLDYFPGLLVEAESNGNSAIIGFSAVDTSLYMDLHYHRIDLELEDLEFKFGLYSQSYQFNQINVDRSGTVLDSWTEQRESIPASLTNDQVFVQGVTGVLTRVEFPTIDFLIELGDKASLIKAELFFMPIKNTYDEIEVPSNTVLYQSDRINRIYDPVYYDDGSTVQQGTVSLDYLYHENTSISFDLTNYFKYDFIDNYYNEEYGFLLGIIDSDYNKNFNRIILGGLNNRDYKPKLKVYYMLYD